MKNPGVSALVIVCLLVITFSAGFFLGRNANHAPVQLSVLPTRPTEPSQPTQAEETGPRMVNINSASLEELTDLDGIGTVLAQRIIDYREEYGPFASVADLMKVEGIGEGILTKNLDRLTV